ncbi:helix-turn-helix transcriptional regulator [Paraburkholderia aspalathi]|nr:helix-turn-helix transcriptional regulator [Paraburkholderia aspalathi]
MLAQRKKIGELIRKRRKELRLTLQALQAKTGINNGNLSKIERGEQGLSTHSRALIAQALSLPVAHLAEDIASGPADFSVPFASKMRARRIQEDITLADLREITNIKAIRLLKLERGEEEPSHEERRLISSALELDVA